MDSSEPRAGDGACPPARGGRARGRTLLRYAVFQIPELAIVPATLVLAPQGDV